MRDRVAGRLAVCSDVAREWGARFLICLCRAGRYQRAQVRVTRYYLRPPLRRLRGYPCGLLISVPHYLLTWIAYYYVSRLCTTSSVLMKPLLMYVEPGSQGTLRT